MTHASWFGRFLPGLVVLLGMGFGVLEGRAGASTLSFEQYCAGTQITTQYAGVSFSNALEETSATVSPSIYTPHSGSGFVTNSDSVLSVSFSGLESVVSGWYAAYDGMTVSAYDGNDNLLSTVVYASAPANVAWSLSGAAGISRVTFSAPADTVAIDDLSYTAASAVTPEPGSLLLLGTGLFSGAAMCVARASRLQRGVSASV